MAQDLQKIQDNVRLLLTKHPKLRGPFMRKQAHWKYWQEFEGLGKLGMAEEQYCKELTSAETISRAIRKTQDENPKLKPSPADQLKRYEQANEFSDFHRKPKTEDEKAEEFSKESLS